MFKNFIKVGLFSIFAIASLNAAEYTAYVGCKLPYNQGTTIAVACIKSVKIDGKYDNYFKLTPSESTYFSLNENFLIEVAGMKSPYIKYLKIVDKSGREVYYEEDDSNYAHFKVKN